MNELNNWSSQDYMAVFKHMANVTDSLVFCGCVEQLLCRVPITHTYVILDQVLQVCSVHLPIHYVFYIVSVPM